jgi:hypothetical protein
MIPFNIIIANKATAVYTGREGYWTRSRVNLFEWLLHVVDSLIYTGILRLCSTFVEGELTFTASAKHVPQ